MSEWRGTTLGEVATVSWGDTSKTKAAYTADGFLAYSASGPDGFLPYADRRGDGVVISAIGAQCGKTWFARGEWSCIKNTMWFQGGPDADTRFLYYATSDPDRWPKRGAAQPFIGLGDAKLLQLQLPPLELQHQIASVLGSIDDLIEKNRRRVAVLEEMVRAIYREWFVHFRYPGHEEVPLVDSSFGSIPGGWEVNAVADLAAIDKGLSYKGAHLADSGIPMANLKCFRPGGGFRRDGAKPYDGPFMPRHQVSTGDLVMANTDLTQAGSVIGSPAFIPRNGFENGGIASHHLFILRPSKNVARHWLYESFRDDRFRSYARSVASGTTVLGFRPLDLAAYQLPVPPPALAGAFDEIAAGLADLREDLAELMEVLAFQRDLLLPRLVTGRIDVSHLDLEALTEAATP